MNERSAVIIAAAGLSTRLGQDKLFLSLGGKPVLSWSVEICQESSTISQIVIVLHRTRIEAGHKLARRRKWDKVTHICAGGERRQDSVFAGLKCISNCDWVLIHDGARPFLTPNLITQGIQAARDTGASAAAVPVKDTIKISGRDNLVTSTPERSSLWSVQTPQVFRFDIIQSAFNRTVTDVTDDASMVERAGYQVKLYIGSHENIKITTEEDLSLAKLIAKRRRVKCM